MVMTLGDDFPSQGMVPGDIDSSVIDEESMFFCDPLFMGEGVGNPLIPEFFSSESVPYFVMSFAGHQHD